MLVTDSTSFKSRNYEIRRADDLAREISKRYPMVSSSKLSSLPHSEAFPEQIDNLHNRLLKTRANTIRALSSCNFELTPKDKILKFLEIIKKDKLGNCAEMTNLAMVFTFLRNIKDTCIADIKNSAEEHLDHNVLYVDNGKRPYIIDPWLGFADYPSNAIQRYKSEYSYIFPFEMAKTQDFKFRKYTYKSDIRTELDKCSRADLREIRQNVMS